MRGEDAYAVLGLRPGSSRAEIDQAYRRLIKRYHPDYADGDVGRAAEINRAYSELRTLSREAPRAAPPAGTRHAQLYARPPARRGGPIFGLAAVAAAVLLAMSASMPRTSPSWPKLSSLGTAAAGGDSDLRSSRASISLDEPLTTELIESSVSDAMRLHAGSDPVQAAQFSRECLRRLGANPSLPMFDSCAAYDEAIAILAVGDPAFESGTFNPAAVTARQVGAARLLSADYFEAESRLQQIRSRVHLILLPGIADAARARQRRSTAHVRVPEIVEVPVVVPTMAQPRFRPRQAVSHAAAAPSPRAHRAAPRRQAGPLVRRAKMPALPPPPPAAEVRQTPAWQQPIKPAWQRPMPSESD